MSTKKDFYAKKKMLKKMYGKKRERNFEWILWIVTATLLIILIIFAIIAQFSPNKTTMDANSFFSFILVGLGLYVAASVFLPNITVKSIVKDVVKSEMDKTDKNMADQCKVINEEIVKLEAHECRMNSYYLLRLEKKSWALGWALKSLYKYEILFSEQEIDERYDDLIDDLDKTITSICTGILDDIENKKLDEYLSKSQYAIKTRYITFFKCVAQYIEMLNTENTSRLSYTEFLSLRESKKKFMKVLTNQTLNLVFMYFSKEVDQSLRDYIKSDHLIINKKILKENIDAYFIQYKEFEYKRILVSEKIGIDLLFKNYEIDLE